MTRIWPCNPHPKFYRFFRFIGRKSKTFSSEDFRLFYLKTKFASESCAHLKCHSYVLSAGKRRNSQTFPRKYSFAEIRQRRKTHTRLLLEKPGDDLCRAAGNGLDPSNPAYARPAVNRVLNLIRFIGAWIARIRRKMVFPSRVSPSTLFLRQDLYPHSDTTLAPPFSSSRVQGPRPPRRLDTCRRPGNFLRRAGGQVIESCRT